MEIMDGLDGRQSKKVEMKCKPRLSLASVPQHVDLIRATPA